jgi:hypothetical protein
VTAAAAAAPLAVVPYRSGITDTPWRNRFVRAIAGNDDETSALASVLREVEADGVDLSHLGDAAEVEAYLRGGIEDAADDYLYGEPVQGLVKVIDLPVAIPLIPAERFEWVVQSAATMKDAFKAMCAYIGPATVRPGSAPNGWAREATDLSSIGDAYAQGEYLEDGLELACTKYTLGGHGAKVNPISGCAAFLPENLVPPPPQEYLVGVPGDGCLPAHLIAGLVGPGAVGKSQTIVQIAVCLALGVPFIGHPVTVAGKKTAIISGEDDVEDFQRKFSSVVETMGLGAAERKKVRASVVILPVMGTGTSIVQSLAGGRFVAGPGVDQLAGEIARVMPDPDLLVIDTLSTMLHHGEDVGPVAAFMDAMNSLKGRFASEPAVLVAHHTSKEVAGRGSHGQDSGRGSSAFGSNARTVITLASVTEANLKDFTRALGGVPHEHVRGRLRLIHVAKVKGSQTRPPRVVEMVQAPSGLGYALKEYFIPVEDKESAKREQYVQAVAFRDLVAQTAVKTGKPVSANALRDPGVPDRTKRAIKARVEAAVKLGLVREEAGKKCGLVLVPLFPDGGAPASDPQGELLAADGDAGQPAAVTPEASA